MLAVPSILPLRWLWEQLGYAWGRCCVRREMLSVLCRLCAVLFVWYRLHVMQLPLSRGSVRSWEVHWWGLPPLAALLTPLPPERLLFVPL